MFMTCCHLPAGSSEDVLHLEEGVMWVDFPVNPLEEDHWLLYNLQLGFMTVVGINREVFMVNVSSSFRAAWTCSHVEFVLSFTATASFICASPLDTIP